MTTIKTTEELYRRSGIITDLFWAVHLTALASDQDWTRKICHLYTRS